MTFVKIKFWSGTQRSWLRLQDDLNASIVRPRRLQWRWWLYLWKIRLMQTKSLPRSSCDDFCSLTFFSFGVCHVSGSTWLANDLDQLSYEWRSCWFVHSQWSHSARGWAVCLITLPITWALLKCGLSACLCLLCAKLHFQYINFVVMTTDDQANVLKTVKRLLWGWGTYETEDNSYYTLQI